MKKLLMFFVVAVGLVLSGSQAQAATPDQDFVDQYKKAFEAKDEATLKSFLYTKDADPEALEFFQMMMTAEMGGKITEIKLRDLTAEETKKAAEVQPSPSGANTKLPVTPNKKLVIKIETNDASAKSTSSSESYVALVDGKYMIPVPVVVK